MILDLHIHTTASDGTDSPGELPEKIREAGIDIFSITDHDTYQGCEAMQKQMGKMVAGRENPVFVYGIELSCRDDLGKYHILGYHFDPEHPAMRGIVAKSHQFRMEKVEGRLRFLKETYGFTFSDGELEELMANPNPGKPHIGNLMVKKGYAPDRTTAIREYINHTPEKKLYIRPEEAIHAIREAGGIPVLAHGFFGDGGQKLDIHEVAARTGRLAAEGLLGLECWYSGYSRQQQEEIRALAERRGMYMTAGSDYHGKNKPISLGETGLEENDWQTEGLQRFLSLVRGD